MKESMQVILEYYFPPLENVLIHINESERAVHNFPRVSVLEMDKISTLPVNKAPVPDGLTMGIIKEAYYSNKDLCVDIFNECMELGYFPLAWKEAKIVLIPKEGKNPQKVSSYRPICLLSTWGKLLDKIITQRLQFELENNAKLSFNQFGFRRNKSTLSALDEFMIYIKESKRQNMITLALAFDISNAFNSVSWHDILKCLEEDSISMYIVNVIKSFLSNRKIVDQDFGISYYYDREIPQGSSLGPIMWLLIAERLLRPLNVIKNV